MTDVIDISNALPLDTATLEILTIDGFDRTGWSVQFAGPAHPQTISWEHEAARKAMKVLDEVERARFKGKTYVPEERGPNEIRKSNVEWIVARIITWTPIKIGADIYTFSREAATDLLMRPNMSWAFRQMLEFITSDRAFAAKTQS